MKQLVFISAFMFFVIHLYSQDYISGIVNNYYQVTSVNTRSVTCSVAPGDTLQRGDKVLLIQMTGHSFNTDSVGWETETDEDVRARKIGHAGFYQFLSVNSVVGTVVNFTADIIDMNYYSTSERIQLVKVYESEKAIVNGTLSARPWNGTTGGICALVIYKRLDFASNGTIDVSSKGFRGAAPTTFTSTCRPNYATDTMYFTEAQTNRGGLKGEGVTSPSFIYKRGPGDNWIGGGGAYGCMGGGGGGGNYGNGGGGGLQNTSCSSNSNCTAESYNFSPYSAIYGLFTFGGGGGGTTRLASQTANNGGNGGGIVIILADTINGNGRTITANGGGVADATGGGAGGGAGGSVILDAASYINNLTIYAVGGKGGSTTINCGGSGGGGGGGLFMYSGTSIPAGVSCTPASSLAGGQKGTANCSSNSGANGSVGGNVSKFKPVLNGFLFNAITGNDTICQGQQPKLIKGTTPKGSGTPVYKWLESTNLVNWTSTGITTQNFQPPVLTSTKYYTRVVQIGTIYDTAFYVVAWVYPSITNNEIYVRDTLCINTSPGILQAREVAGGNLTYEYTWQKSTNQVDWIYLGNDKENAEGKLSSSTYYRRIVTSAKVCTSTSETDLITIIPDISNNSFITADTTICKFNNAGTIKLHALLSGGDGSYRFSWISSSDNISYLPVSGTGSTLAPGSLISTRFYKRIVYSGNDDACMDTTDVPRTVNVLEPITGNSITSESTRYCAGNNTLALTQSGLLTGGNGIYNYQWYIREGAVYNVISGAISENFTPGALEDTSIYRRQVISGDDNACVSNSNDLTIDVIPYIINILQSSGDTLCEGYNPALFAENSATGGANVYSYRWLQKTLSSGWTDVSGSGNSVSFDPPLLTETTLYTRVVNSQICADTSNIITILIYPDISNNSITGSLEKYNCFNTPALLNGTDPDGGNGYYNYFWQTSVNNVSWNNTSGTNKDLSSEPTTDEVYFRRIVHSGETAQCKDTSNAVHVLIKPLPSGDIYSGIDTLCSGTNISISYIVSGTGPWVIGLGENTVLHTENVADSTGTISFMLNNTANINVLSIEDDSSCFADLSADTGLMVATVYKMPVADPGEDTEVCGLQVQLAANASVDQGIWKLNGGEFNDPTLPNATVTAPDYGLQTLVWTETNWRECIDSNELDIIFYKQPDSAYAGEDINLAYEFVTKLNAHEPENGFGSWQFTSGNGTFNGDSTKADVEVVFNKIGSYELKWTVVNGICAPVSDLLNIIIKDISLYTGFSPNGDGINDELTFDLPEGRNATLIIIDKNGNKVIEISGNTVIKWDGLNENGEVPDDTYYYILIEDNGYKRKDYVELRR